jgi:hypothetical protein
VADGVAFDVDDGVSALSGHPTRACRAVEISTGNGTISVVRIHVGDFKARGLGISRALPKQSHDA